MVTLKLVKFKPREMDDALKESLADASRANELEGRLRDDKIASSLPQVDSSSETSKTNGLETYLDALREMKPEAEKYFISSILKRYYGLKSSSNTDDGVVDFSSVDNQAKGLVNKVNRLGTTINHYLEFTYHKDFKSNCKDLEYLAEVGLLNQDKFKIYEAALTKINKTFHNRSLRKDSNYSFTLFSKYIALPVTALTSLACLGSGADVGVTTLASVTSLTLLEVVGALSTICFDRPSFTNQYRNALLKHLFKHKDTFEIHLPVALQSAQELQEQLLHPKAIKEKYNNPADLVRIRATLHNSAESIKRSITYLTNLNNWSK